MQIWGTGVFDNAAALEWAGQFDRTAGAKRSEMVRSALSTSLADDEVHTWLRALAAATTVAAGLPGGPLLAADYGPESLGDNQFRSSTDLAEYAITVLGRCVAVDTEWTRMWTGVALLDDALAVADAVIGELQERSARALRVREAS
jgi:GNAT superfamily N-acetyltransferase